MVALLSIYTLYEGANCLSLCIYFYACCRNIGDSTTKIPDTYDVHVSLQGSVRVSDGHNIMFNFKLLPGDNNQSWRLDTDLHI